MCIKEELCCNSSEAQRRKVEQLIHITLNEFQTSRQCVKSTSFFALKKICAHGGRVIEPWNIAAPQICLWSCRPSFRSLAEDWEIKTVVQMRVVGQESPTMEPDPPNPMGSPLASVGTSDVDVHAGVDRNASETNQVMDTTVVSSIASPEGSGSAERDHVACKGFRRRWREKKAGGSDRSEALGLGLSCASGFDPVEEYTPSFINPVSELGVDDVEAEGIVGASHSSARMADHSFLSNAKVVQHSVALGEQMCAGHL